MLKTPVQLPSVFPTALGICPRNYPTLFTSICKLENPRRKLTYLRITNMQFLTLHFRVLVLPISSHFRLVFTKHLTKFVHHYTMYPVFEIPTVITVQGRCLLRYCTSLLSADFFWDTLQQYCFQDSWDTIYHDTLKKTTSNILCTARDLRFLQLLYIADSFRLLLKYCVVSYLQDTVYCYCNLKISTKILCCHYCFWRTYRDTVY